jgi:succinate dehydrogenase / fumarate reductase cytochrome b subunit
MVLFVIVHLLGNSSIFLGPNGLNSYAEHLHSLGPLVWVFRLAMLTFFLVHGFFGIQLTLENSAANQEKYAVSRKLKANFASDNMIWTGLILGLFVIYHLTHFTGRVWSDVSAFASQVPGNVFGMVTSSFSHGAIAFTYIAAMAVLCIHLFHGIQSFFQTMGWNNNRSLPVISQAGRALAFVFLFGYSSIPLFILVGIIK